MSVKHGRHAVARAVDVDDLAGLCDGVCGGQIDLRLRRALFRLLRVAHAVPIDRIVRAEPVVKRQLPDRDAAADADRAPVKL